MNVGVIATLVNEDSSVLDALTHQTGKWVIEHNVELVFVAKPLDQLSATDCTKVVMRFKTETLADNFIAEFHRDDRHHDVLFERLELSSIPMIEALKVRF